MHPSRESRSNPQPRSPRLSVWAFLGLVAIVMWLLVDRYSYILYDPNAVPRAITPRGNLAQDEETTIELLRNKHSASASVSA